MPTIYLKDPIKEGISSEIQVSEYTITKHEGIYIVKAYLYESYQKIFNGKQVIIPFTNVALIAN
jgi:hypothetical protein